MDYYVNVTVQIDKCYKVRADDDYEARDEAEGRACKEYGNDPDFSSADAWDVTPANKVIPKMISWMQHFDGSVFTK